MAISARRGFPCTTFVTIVPGAGGLGYLGFLTGAGCPGGNWVAVLGCPGGNGVAVLGCPGGSGPVGAVVVGRVCASRSDASADRAFTCTMALSARAVFLSELAAMKTPNQGAACVGAATAASRYRVMANS